MNSELISQLMRDPLAATIQYYAQCLPISPKAIEYLERMALSSDSTLRIGFSDRTLGTHIPSKVTKAGRELRQRLQSLGVLKENGREVFRGMVTLPLEVDGQVTGVFGLRIDRHSKEPAQVVCGGGIFNAQALEQFDELIVTDNLLDAWAFYSAGHTNIICAVNHGLTITECSKLRRVQLTAETIDCEAFSQCEIHRLRLPEGHSAHDLSLGPAQNTDPLGDLLRAATWQSGSAMQLAKVRSVEATSIRASDNAPTTTPSPIPSIEPPAAKPQASPLPKPMDDFQATITDQEVILIAENLRWRIRGLDRNTLSGVMKVNLLVTSLRNDRFHVDCFDLYHARSRRVFTAEASEELGCAEADLRSQLGRVLLKLEELQTQAKSLAKAPKPIDMSLAEREAAMELLQDENLLQRILTDFETCGVVGERNGKLVGYLAATSRLLDKPLGLIIQSSSAAGKTSLAQAILRFMPDESQLVCSSMTSQSLYYLGREELTHKILFLVEEEGVRDASYQLKLLQSEGQLSLVATGKEQGTGRTGTERYEVHGPVALIMTTTSSTVDPELLNRCVVVAIDESRTQTVAIQAQQRFNETLDGFMQREASKRLCHLHQNAQRLLRPLPVFNPYASQLSFIGWETRHRRDHGKYLALINSVTLLHQHQRTIKETRIEGQSVEYLEVTRRDIAVANLIADWALGRSIDELAEPTRRLLVELYDWVRGQAETQGCKTSGIEFTRRAARESLQWRCTQLNDHLQRLCQAEYVVRTHGGSNGRLGQYKLLYDGRGREGQPCVLELVDSQSLVEPTPSTPTLSDLSD